MATLNSTNLYFAELCKLWLQHACLLYRTHFLECRSLRFRVANFLVFFVKMDLLVGIYQDPLSQIGNTASSDKLGTNVYCCERCVLTKVEQRVSYCIIHTVSCKLTINISGFAWPNTNPFVVPMATLIPTNVFWKPLIVKRTQTSKWPQKANVLTSQPLRLR